MRGRSARRSAPTPMADASRTPCEREALASLRGSPLTADRGTLYRLKSIDRAPCRAHVCTPRGRGGAMGGAQFLN